MDLRRLERGRALVLEQRRDLVHALAEHLLLHQDLAEAHVDRALDLPFDEQRVQRAADVVRDPDLGRLDLARLRVDVHLDDARRVRVARATARRRRPCTCPRAWAARRSRGTRARRACSRRAPPPRAKDTPRSRSSATKTRRSRDHEPPGVHLELLRHRREDAARAAASAAWIAALPAISVTRDEYEPRSTGVRSVSAGCTRMSLGSMPSTSADEVGQDRVRALADVGGAAEHGHQPAAIGADDDAGVRHVVPVDRRARARQVRRARRCRCPCRARQLASPRLLRASPERLHHAVDALAEPDRRHRQVVGRLGERLGDDCAAACRPGRGRAARAALSSWHSMREARLRRAVAALGAARRLVGEDARALELVHGDLVGHRSGARPCRRSRPRRRSRRRRRRARSGSACR